MVAEAHWILTGQNRVETIKPYSKQIERFSDDGIYYHGAYGPKVVDQLSYIVDTLSKDLYSRQAVINIWRENPRPSKDVPCTLNLQFTCRADRLNCIATMRSSDAWLGWVYDVFNFSMISEHVRQLLILRDKSNARLELGTLTLTAGSQHLYDTNLEAVRDVLENPNDLYPEIQRVECTPDIVGYLDYIKDFDLYQHNVNKKALAENWIYLGGFLNDLFETVYGEGA